MEFVLLIAATVSIMMFALFIFTYDNTILVEQLPTAVKAFVQKNFPGEGIACAMMDAGITKTTYGVHLKNGVELELDTYGNWDKVNCNYEAVPVQLIPARVSNYVQTNYAGTVITKIGKKSDGYQVELSNDLYLQFSNRGMLIGFGD